MKKKIACYCRVSTSHQIDRESIPSQKHMIANYVKMLQKNTEDIIYYVDAGFSGKNTNRPEFEKMMKDIESGTIEYVMTWKIDRISRNLLDFSKFIDTLNKNKVSFISLSEQFDTSTAIGQAMLKMLMLFAELERNMTSERVMSVSKDIVSRGGRLGGPVALGYDYDKSTKTFKINEKEAEIVRKIFTMIIDGNSTATISNCLNDNNITSKRGRNWSSTTVYHILENVSYKGWYRWNRYSSGRKEKKDESEWITNKDFYPVIIDEKTFDLAQKLLKSRTNNSNMPRTKRKHLFSQLLYCADCGRRMGSRRDRTRKNKIEISNYYCYGHVMHWNCENDKYVSDVTLAKFILQYLANLAKFSKIRKIICKKDELNQIFTKYISEKPKIANIDMLYALLTDAAEDSTTEKAETAKREVMSATSEANMQIEKLEKALSRLKDLFLFAESEMTKEEYASKRKEIEKKIESIRAEAKKKSSKASIDFLKLRNNYADIIEYLENTEIIDYVEAQKKLSHEDLCKFMHDCLKEVIINKTEIVKITFANDVSHCFKYE